MSVLPAKIVPQYAGFDVCRTKDRSAHIAVYDEGGIKKLSVLDIVAKAIFEAQENLLIDFLCLNHLAMQKIDKTGIGMSVAEKGKKTLPFEGAKKRGGLFHAKQQRGHGFKFKKAL